MEGEMTEQEKQLITGLADRIRNAPAPQIDRDADDLIRRTIGSRPDGLYILTQTVLIQEMALNQAKQQIEALKQQTGQPLGNFLPQSQPEPESGGQRWGREAPPAPPPSGGYRGSSYQHEAPQPPAYSAPPQQPGSGFSGFLHNAATTAAGVLAGELAWSSLTSLFGHHGGYYGGGFLGGPVGGISPGSETIINNYYEEPGDTRDRDDDSRFADAASQDQNISPDIDDERDNSGDRFADDSGNDDSDIDDSDDSDSDSDDSADDYSGDDDSSFDTGDDGGSTDV
jgi:uncharacterized protein